MIRVFLIALLSLGALVLVSRNLPERPAPPPQAPAAAEASPFAAWDGVWEGTFRAYLPDGTLQTSIQARHEYRSISASEQSVVITDLLPDGTTRLSAGSNTVVDGRLECRIQEADGRMRVLTGRRQGPVLFWQRHEEADGMHELLREEVVHTAEGDLYTVDGVGVYGGADARVLLLEGRYRRVDRTAP